MVSYSFKIKKKMNDERKKVLMGQEYGPEVGIKNGCNVNVWSYIPLCI